MVGIFYPKSVSNGIGGSIKRTAREIQTERLIRAATNGDAALVRKLSTKATWYLKKKELKKLLETGDIKSHEIEKLIKNLLYEPISINFSSIPE